MNWHIVQHPQTGFIYVGNNFGVLEFDGTAWRLYPMPGEGPVRAVAIDRDGVIWLSGLNEVATLQPNARGQFEAVAVTQRLGVDDRKFGNATHQLVTPAAVYFAAGRRLLRFGFNGAAQSLLARGPISGLWWHEGALHLALGTVGFHRLIGDDIVPVSGSAGDPSAPVTPSRPVLAARADEAGTILLTSRGPMRWRGGQSPLQPLSAESAAWFSEEPATAAAFLPDGGFVFGFLRRGLHVFTAAGRSVQQLDEAHGLPANRIEELAADAEGGLWVAQRSGLTRLQWDSRYALHGSPQGLPGSPRVMLRHGDRLYVAHNEGLAWRHDITGAFHSVKGLSTGLTTLLASGDRLFGPGSTLYEILPDDRAQSVLGAFLLSILSIPGAPGFFLGGNSTEVVLLQFDGTTWRHEGRIASVTEGGTRFADGGDGTIWAAAYTGRGLWRIDFRGGVNVRAPATRFDQEHGVPEARRRDSPRIVRLGDDIVATSGTWTRRYDRAANRFVPETRIAGLAADTGATAVQLRASPAPWWFLTSPLEQLAQVTPVGESRWQLKTVGSGPLRRIVPNGMYHDEPTQTVWIAGQGALISADSNWQPARPRPPLRVVIRSVTTASGEVLEGGSRAHGAGDVRILSAAQNALRFTFAAPTFEGDWQGKSGTVFRTRLDGLDTGWSDWAPLALRDFTNLPYHALTLRVQARDLDGRESPEATFAFAIAAPWWLTRWAVGAYALAGIAGVFGVVRLRTRTLRRHNLHLESLVAARTTELARLRQIDRDESAAAKLAEEKTRLEMLRYQLNPHFLYNALNSIRALIFSRPPAAGDMVSQLADLCRVTLTRNEESAPVSDEFAMLNLYLDMEKTRWRDKLAVEIDLAPDAAKQLIPPFLLLPLVENALKHGRQSSTGVMSLRLAARLDGSGTASRSVGKSTLARDGRVRRSATHLEQDSLLLEVANTGVWLEPGQSIAPSTGIGLENLRQRLKRYYPGAHELTTTAEDGWVVVQLRLVSLPR